MSSDAAQLTGAARGLPPHGLIAVAWIGFAVAALLVALRCYARLTETKRLHPDDYWILAALFLLLANAVLQTLQTDSLYYLVWVSTGRVPAGQPLLNQGNVYVRYEFTIIGVFWTIIWSVKASFLALYYRLFDGMPHYLRMWWFVTVFTALAYVGCWIASVWTCHPPSTYFTFGACTKPEDVKGSIISISYSTAVDVITDLMIMFLPIRLLQKLQVDRRQKVGLAGIFGVAVIIIVAAIVRCTQIVAYARTDPVGLAVWSLVESSISVMVGALPALKALLTRTILRSLNRSHLRSGSSLEADEYLSSTQRSAIGGRARFGSKAIHLQDRGRPESQEHIARYPAIEVA